MITPTSKQYNAICAMAKDKVVLSAGSVRSGKTVAVCFALPVLVVRHRGQEGLSIICTKTLKNAEINLLGPARNIYGEQAIGYIRDKSYCIIFGEKFYILPFNDDSSYQKIQGITVKLCIADELVLSPESFFTMLLSRLSTSDSQLVATMNPSSPLHYMKRYIDDPYVDEEMTVKKRLFHWTLDDNPTLDRLYVSGLKNAYKGNKSLYDRYINGLWVSAEGLAYHAFDATANTAEKDEVDRGQLQRTTRRLLIGVDGAVNKDSTACVPAFVDWNDNALIWDRFVHDPKASVPLSSDRQVELIAQWLEDLDAQVNWRVMNLEQKIIVVDCAATDLILLLRHRFPNWDVIAFTRKDQRKMVGAVNSCFSRNKIRIVKQCDYDYYRKMPTGEDRLISELGTVEVKDIVTDRLVLNPVFPNDVSDGLKYLAAYYYGYDDLNIS